MIKIELKNPKLYRRKTRTFSVEVLVSSETGLWIIPEFFIQYFTNEKITVQTEKAWLEKFLESEQFNFEPRVLSDGCISEGFTKEEFKMIPQLLENLDLTEYVAAVNRQLKHKRKKEKNMFNFHKKTDSDTTKKTEVEGEQNYSEKKLVLLVDAENITLKALDFILTESQKLGELAVKKAYADWSNPSYAQWKKLLIDFGFHPVQQLTYVAKKNASDIALSIDAMDLLYHSNFDAFCLATSDSDFTPLVLRLKESGKSVYGFGKENGVNAFKVACDKYFDVDKLPEKTADSPVSNNSSFHQWLWTKLLREKKKANNTKRLITTRTEISEQILMKMTQAYEDQKSSDNWANLAEVCSCLSNKYLVKTANIPYKKLSLAYQNLPDYEFKKRRGKNNAKVTFIRRKKSSGKVKLH